MAETEVALPEIDSNALFRGAMDDPPQEAPPETPAPQPEAEAKTENPDRPRDERGRFISEAKEADAAPTQQPAEVKEEAEAAVPSWRLREIREERDALKSRADEVARQNEAFQREVAEMRRQMAELNKPKQEPVDFFADPNAAFKQQLTPFEERMAQLESNLNMKMSRAAAVIEHGKEAVAEMEKAVEDAMRSNHPSVRALRAQLANTDDPVGTAMQWHTSNKMLRETGGDLAKFRAKIAEELLKDPKFQAQAIEAAKGAVQAKQTTPNINLPPSLNKVAGSGGSSEVVGDLTNDSLWAHARTGR